MKNGETYYRAYLDGDNSAFDSIIDIYRDPLIFFVNRTVNNLHTAEDIAADALAELIIHKRRFKFKCSLKTYLFTIAHNKAVDFIRKQARYGFVQTEEALSAEYTEYVESTVIKNQQNAILNEALNALNEEYKTALHLVYFEELSYDECAAVLKKSKKQTEGILYRARKALKSELENRGFSYEE